MSFDNPIPAVAHPDDEQVFAATLVPHRSLTPRGVKILIACVGFVSLCTSLPFFLMGAWPVAGFFGLDVILLYLAFRASMKSARAYEQIVITHVELLLCKVTARGQVRNWSFNPNWTKLRIDEHEEFGTQKVQLVQGRETVDIGGFLGADEKGMVANDLKLALAEARRGRRFSN